jgi:hypothetical protein
MEINPTSSMNLYIINEVLTDYTSGMVVIAAESIDRAREIFVDNDQFFGELAEFNAATMRGFYRVIEGVNHPEGVVSYVFGGG